MAVKKLYAKDRRKLKRRRWTSVALTVGGVGALALLGWYLYRKIVADKTPAPGQVKEWSGCLLEPPDWVQPRPRFSCGTNVAYNDGETTQTGYVTGRTWTQGMWVYETTGSFGSTEEANLQEA